MHRAVSQLLSQNQKLKVMGQLKNGSIPSILGCFERTPGDSSTCRAIDAIFQTDRMPTKLVSHAHVLNMGPMVADLGDIIAHHEGWGPGDRLEQSHSQTGCMTTDSGCLEWN